MKASCVPAQNGDVFPSHCRQLVLLRRMEIGSFSQSMKASCVPAQNGNKMFYLVTEDRSCCCAVWK